MNKYNEATKKLLDECIDVNATIINMTYSTGYALIELFDGTITSLSYNEETNEWN